MIHDSDGKAEQSCYGLRLGARGWQHADWQQSFYPEDLPEDWQLGYYANEFSAVLVPRSYWLPETGFDIEEWLDHVSGHFRFYLEWPLAAVDSPGCSLFLEQCQALGSLLGGIIMPEGLVLEASLPVFYQSAANDLQQLLWTPEQQGMSGIAFLSLAKQDLRTQRQWLESFAASGAELQAVLITDQSPAMESLHKLKTLIELLGL